MILMEAIEFDNRTGKKDVWAISHDNDIFDFSIVNIGQIVKTTMNVIDVYSPTRNDYELRLGNLQFIIQISLKERVDSRAINTFIKLYIEDIIAYISDGSDQFSRDILDYSEEWLDAEYNDTTLRLYFIDVIDGVSDDSFNI